MVDMLSLGCFYRYMDRSNLNSFPSLKIVKNKQAGYSLTFKLQTAEMGFVNKEGLTVSERISLTDAYFGST